MKQGLRNTTMSRSELGSVQCRAFEMRALPILQAIKTKSTDNYEAYFLLLAGMWKRPWPPDPPFTDLMRRDYQDFHAAIGAVGKMCSKHSSHVVTLSTCATPGWCAMNFRYR